MNDRTSMCRNLVLTGVELKVIFMLCPEEERALKGTQLLKEKKERKLMHKLKHLKEQ